MLLQVLLLLVYSSILGHILGSRKGAAKQGAVLGLLLGPPGVLFVLAMRGDQKDCPFCFMLVRGPATVCPYCENPQPEKKADTGEDEDPLREERKLF